MGELDFKRLGDLFRARLGTPGMPARNAEAKVIRYMRDLGYEPVAPKDVPRACRKAGRVFFLRRKPLCTKAWLATGDIRQAVGRRMEQQLGFPVHVHYWVMRDNLVSVEVLPVG